MGLILEGKWTDNEPEKLKETAKYSILWRFNNSISKNDLNFKPDFGEISTIRKSYMSLVTFRDNCSTS